MVFVTLLTLLPLIRQSDLTDHRELSHPNLRRDDKVCHDILNPSDRQKRCY